MKTLTAERVRALFDYRPETGSLTWRRRPQSDFCNARVCALWNSRFAGEDAGSFDKDGYREVGIDNRSFKAHRLIWTWMTGEWPTFDIDHKDGVKSNNAFSNLRHVTRTVNTENQRRARSDNQSGLLGASLHKASGLYHACIKANGKKHSLGYYRDPADAHAAYVAAKRQLHEGCTL